MDRINKYLLFFSKNIYLIFIVIFYVLFYLLNHYTPMLEDDCNYALTWSGERIQSFGEIIETQIWHYFHINGRFFSHTLIQVFCGLTGKTFFNFLNPIILLLIPLMLLKILEVKINSSKGFFVFSISLAFLQFIIPDQYVTKLMIAGSVNYMWAILIYLIYLYLIKSYLLKRNNEINLKYVFLIIFSLFVGGFVEFFSIALLPAAIVMLIIKRKEYFNRNNVLILFAFFVGTLLVTLAPGNFSRRASLYTQQSSISMLKQIINFIFYFSTEVYIILLIIVLIALFFVKKFQYVKIKRFIKENLFYILAICFSLGFTMVSGAWWSRVFVPFYLFLFILFLKIIVEIQATKTIYLIISMLLVLSIFFDSFVQIKTLKYNYGIFKNIEKQIIQNNGGLCLQEKELKDTRMANISPWYVSSINAKNIWLQGYYQTNPIFIVKRELYLMLKEHKNEILNSPFYYDRKNKVFVCVRKGDDINYLNITYKNQANLVLRGKFIKIFNFLGLLEKYPITCQTSDCSKILYTKPELNRKIYYNDYHESFSVLNTSFGNFLLLQSKNEFLPIQNIEIVYKKEYND